MVPWCHSEAIGSAGFAFGPRLKLSHEGVCRGGCGRLRGSTPGGLVATETLMAFHDGTLEEVFKEMPVN